MLQNAYFLAKIGADTAENEQHFAEIWCKKLATTRRRMHAMDSLAATLGPRCHDVQLRVEKDDSVVLLP